MSHSDRTETGLPAAGGAAPDAPAERVWSALPASSATEEVAAVVDDGAEIVAGFRIVRAIGEGGMATVFEAVHLQSGQRVALKRVRADARKDQQYIDRFLREVRAASKLDHPCICRVYAGGDDGKDVFMAVELVEGGDLDALIERIGGAVPAAAVAVIIAQLLEALDHAHGHGIVHRDIKPANIMLGADGGLKLVDFGIARADDDVRLTATGLVVGTPAYMSPEQARGQPVDARSDLFSVGVVLVELLTGTNPFQGETATATVLKILTESLPPLNALDPTIPGVLAQVADGLLQRDPARRYPSARAALADLAPYRRLVDDDQPGVVRRCLIDPAGARQQMRAHQSAFEMERANDLLALGEPGLAAASLALLRAQRLQPDSQVAKARFADVCGRGGFDFTPSDPRIVAVEADIQRTPFQAALLKRAAELHRAAKNPLGQAAWLARYLQMQPTDELARRQWSALVVGPTTKTTPQKLNTREIIDGVKTGGWKAAGNPTEAVAAVVVAPPAPRPPRPAPARPTPMIGTSNVVVVQESSGGAGRVVVGAVVVVLLCLAGLIVSKTWNEIGSAERDRGARGVALLDATPELSVKALDEMNLARAAIEKKRGSDAVDAATRAVSLGGLSPDEELEAILLRAQGEELIGDTASARLSINRFLKDARLSHPSRAQALALEKRVTR
ncbi:MAG: serine/threonine-protein kinase [Deltaproteobacteria bacterium]|nr:serine/threonine-protein kinase [Deltaproteobacteria bacterium]